MVNLEVVDALVEEDVGRHPQNLLQTNFPHMVVWGTEPSEKKSFIYFYFLLFLLLSSFRFNHRSHYKGDSTVNARYLKRMFTFWIVKINGNIIRPPIFLHISRLQRSSRMCNKIIFHIKKKSFNLWQEHISLMRLI